MWTNVDELKLHIRLIKLCKNVETLDLRGCALELVDDLKAALVTTDLVSFKLSVRTLGNTSQGTKVFSIPQLLNFIQAWPRLENLDVYLGDDYGITFGEEEVKVPIDTKTSVELGKSEDAEVTVSSPQPKLSLFARKKLEKERKEQLEKEQQEKEKLKEQEDGKREVEEKQEEQKEKLEKEEEKQKEQEEKEAENEKEDQSLEKKVNEEKQEEVIEDKKQEGEEVKDEIPNETQNTEQEIADQTSAPAEKGEDQVIAFEQEQNQSEPESNNDRSKEEEEKDVQKPEEGLPVTEASEIKTSPPKAEESLTEVEKPDENSSAE